MFSPVFRFVVLAEIKLSVTFQQVNAGAENNHFFVPNVEEAKDAFFKLLIIGCSVIFQIDFFDILGGFAADIKIIVYA